MPLDVLIPMLVLPLIVFGAFMWYRHAMRRLEADTERRDIPGGRLTSEHLRQLTAPPWRVVYEIGADRLAGVDHVVIGPSGVIGIATVMADRPDHERSTDPNLVAAAATMRAAVGEITDPVGIGCEALAKVFWGSPQPDQPPARELTKSSVGVVGQRLREWLATLPADVLTPAEVDLAWQTIVVGIGRPDPLG